MSIDPRTFLSKGLPGHGIWNSSLVMNPKWDFINQHKWFLFDPGAQNLPGLITGIWQAAIIPPTYWNVAGGRKIVPVSPADPFRQPLWVNQFYRFNQSIASGRPIHSVPTPTARINQNHRSNGSRKASFFKWKPADGNGAGANVYPSGATTSSTNTLAMSIHIASGQPWTNDRTVCRIGDMICKIKRDVSFGGPSVTFENFISFNDSDVFQAFIPPEYEDKMFGQHSIVFASSPDGTTIYWNGKPIGATPFFSDQPSAPEFAFSSVRTDVGEFGPVDPPENVAFRGSVEQILWCAETKWSAENVEMWHEDQFGHLETMIPTSSRLVIPPFIPPPPGCVEFASQVLPSVDASGRVLPSVSAAGQVLSSVEGSGEVVADVEADGEVFSSVEGEGEVC